MNPYNIMVAISVTFMVYLILIPLGQVIIQILTLTGADAARVDGGREGMFTSCYWRRALTSGISRKMPWTPFKNSLLISVCTVAFRITLGSLLAWLVIRSDLPYKKPFFLTLIISYMIPSWYKSMVQLIISKNERMGDAQGLLGFSGTQTPDWLAYGPSVITVVLVIHYYAHAYLLMSSALSSISSELEGIGGILGAGKARVLTKITLLLVTPATLSAVIMTFPRAMGTLGVPSVLGLRIGYHIVSTTICNSIQDGQSRVAFAIPLILIAIASFSVSLNQRATDSRKSSSTIEGKENRNNLIRLGKWRPVIMGILTAFIAVAMVFPVAILLYQPFILRLGNYSLNNFTLHYWTRGFVSTIDQGGPSIFGNPQFMKYVANTTRLVVLTSLLATTFGQLIGYINSRGRRLFSGELVEQLVFIPYLIPSIASNAMYLTLFATAREIEMMSYRITLVPSLYRTFALPVLTAVVKNIPFASRTGTSNMLRVSAELEETAQVENAGFPRRSLKIVFPLPKDGMISGFMLVFISIMKELDLIVTLMTPSQQTLPYMVYAYSTENLVQLPSTATIAMFMLVFFVYWLANTFTDTDVTRDS